MESTEDSASPTRAHVSYITFIALTACSILLAGCDPISNERVTLQLPSTAGADTAKGAVELISEVMTNAGFTQTRASAYSNATIVASFKGSGRLACVVYHRSNHLEVVMQEMGRMQSRPEAIKARDDLNRKLSEKYGKEKVSQ